MATNKTRLVLSVRQANISGGHQQINDDTPPVSSAVSAEIVGMKFAGGVDLAELLARAHPDCEDHHQGKNGHAGTTGNDTRQAHA